MKKNVIGDQNTLKIYLNPLTFLEKLTWYSKREKRKS